MPVHRPRPSIEDINRLEWYTTTEAAEIADMSKGLMRFYARDGRVPSKLVGRNRLIRGRDLLKFLEEPRPFGRPWKRRRRRKVTAQ